MNAIQVQGLKLFFHLFTHIPSAAISVLAAPPKNERGVTLDPHSHAFSRMRGQLAEDLAPDAAPRERAEMERFAASVSGSAPRLIRTKDLVIAGCAARVYRPRKPALKNTGLVYFHGGGWVLGNLGTHDSLCRRLAKRLSCTVIAIDYRLAPEFPFPAAFDDALASYREVLNRARELELDPKMIAVGGDSAGGNLAAAVAIATREDRPPLAQFLIYPVTDASREHPSYELFEDGVLTRARMRWFRDRYLGPHVLSEDPRVSPLCMPDLTGLCPAYVVTAGFDVLRDEGRAYAERLKQAGNRVTAAHYDHLPHAFFSTEGLSLAGRDAALEATERFRDLLITAQAARF